MESAEPLIKALAAKSKQASLLWLDGVIEACCLHRVVILCLRSRKLLIRTGQCFLLNGLIFLGSLFILKSVIIPMLLWILPDQSSQINSQELSSFDGVLNFYSFLRNGLVQFFYLFWFYPLYILSFILSALWYNDIAKYGFAAIGLPEPLTVDSLRQNKEEVSPLQNTARMDRPAGLGGVMIGIGEQVYSALLMTFFFLEVYIAAFFPYIGKPLNFLLLSWMYAYYCFEYKWNFTEVSLDKRLDFFESNWAFFAGFGSPCVLSIFFFSPLVGYGVMAILYPLFVLAATVSRVEQDIATQRRKWRGAGLGRIPIFYAADTFSMRVLSLFPQQSQEQKQENKAL